MGKAEWNENDPLENLTHAIDGLEMKAGFPTPAGQPLTKRSRRAATSAGRATEGIASARSV